MAWGIPRFGQDFGLFLHRIGRGRAVMKRQIHHRRGDIFDRLEPHVIGRRGQHPVQHIGGHRLARLGMGGKFRKHFRHFQPVLIKLARQFHEIARDGRAANTLVSHIR
jgi:hypothetical protein